MIENWDQYKDLEYYPDRVCKCGCGGRIKVQSHHKYGGIPEYARGHNRRTRGEGWVEDWDQYKDLEYYPDRVCACGCGGRIRVSSSHRLDGIPKYICGHSNKRVLRETRICECGCKETFECLVTSKQRYIRKHRKGTNLLLIAEVEAILSGEKEAPLCACSCGEKVDVKFCHRSEGIPKYIHGHNSKNGNNSFLGHTHTKEAKEKNRQKHLGKNNANFGKRGEGVTFYGGHHTEEARYRIGIAQLGENNYNWAGGPAPGDYPLEFNEKLREFIRRRDNHICQRCGRLQEENRRRLDVHHIDYIKKNCNITNLITLCDSCNASVNKDREYWTTFFQGKIELIYGVLV